MADRVLDDNLFLREVDGQGWYLCRHCSTVIASAGPEWRAEHRTVHVGSPSSAGPHLNDNFRKYLDVDVVVRQGYCPGCFTALFTEVVPVHPGDAGDRGTR